MNDWWIYEWLLSSGSSGVIDHRGRKGKCSCKPGKFLGGYRSAGLACWKPALFVWVKPTFVTQQKHISLHNKGPAFLVYCLTEQGDVWTGWWVRWAQPTCTQMASTWFTCARGGDTGNVVSPYADSQTVHTRTHTHTHRVTDLVWEYTVLTHILLCVMHTHAFGPSFQEKYLLF